MFDIMANLVEKKRLMELECDRFLEANYLGLFNVRNSVITKSHDINFGTKTSHLLAEAKVSYNIDVIKTEFKMYFIEMTNIFK